MPKVLPPSVLWVTPRDPPHFPSGEVSLRGDLLCDGLYSLLRECHARDTVFAELEGKTRMSLRWALNCSCLRRIFLHGVRFLTPRVGLASSFVLAGSSLLLVLQQRDLKRGDSHYEFGLRDLRYLWRKYPLHICQRLGDGEPHPGSGPIIWAHP